MRRGRSEGGQANEKCTVAQTHEVCTRDYMVEAGKLLNGNEESVRTRREMSLGAATCSRFNGTASRLDPHFCDRCS